LGNEIWRNVAAGNEFPNAIFVLYESSPNMAGEK